MLFLVHRRYEGSSDYRLDGRQTAIDACPPRTTRLMKLGRSEHEVLVGECNRGESHLPRLADEAGNLADGIAHRIRRADV